MLHVRLLEWFPAELVWLYVDHTTPLTVAGDACSRSADPNNVLKRLLYTTIP